MGLSNYLASSRISQSGVCTSTTRPASPYEGQVIYESDTNRVLVYDNSAWVMVLDTDQPPGLQLIKSQTVGTAVSSVTVSDVFSSEYQNYRIIYTDGGASSTSNISMKLGSTTTGYYGYLTYGVSSTTTLFGVNSNNTAAWNYIGDTTSNGATVDCDIFNPFLSIRTQLSARYMGTAAGAAFGIYNALLSNSTSYTSFTLTPGVGTITGGTIRVYGYRN
jgi:hypothetical protein